MFITKKKLEKMIEDKAQVMADGKMHDFWREREMDDRFRGVYERITDVNKRVDDLDKRVRKLEEELHPENSIALLRDEDRTCCVRPY